MSGAECYQVDQKFGYRLINNEGFFDLEVEAVKILEATHLVLAEEYKEISRPVFNNSILNMAFNDVNFEYLHLYKWNYNRVIINGKNILSRRNQMWFNDNNEVLTNKFKKLDIYNIYDAIEYVREIPYKQIVDFNDCALVLDENYGNCALKHLLIKKLAVENNFNDVQLKLCTFNLSTNIFPFLQGVFEDKPFKSFPEMHCYLELDGNSYDVTAKNHKFETIKNNILDYNEVLNDEDLDDIIKLMNSKYDEIIVKWIEKKKLIDVDLKTFKEIRSAIIELIVKKYI